jgi:putative ATPase
LVGFAAAEESIQRRAVLYDRDGDYHFDTISAFIKSLRGSDPDAALYWLAKMVRAGEDPSFIFRRMIILAAEDVGLADPQAIGVVIACAEAFDRIGFPEGNFPLTQACLYLATAPKSNSSMAFFDALKEVEKEDAEVPNHLRDPSRDGEGFGHGEGYIYPHAYRDHWAAQQYLPSALRGRIFYLPSPVGYEGRIRDEVLRKRELQAAMVLNGEASAADGEILTWSAGARGREGWFKRLEAGRSRVLLSDRDHIFEQCTVKRSDRLLIPAANDGLLLWEGLRRVPEGLAAALVDSEAAKEALLRLSPALEETEKPRVALCAGLPGPAEAEAWFGSPAFEHILAREPWRRITASPGQGGVFAAFAEAARLLLAPGGDLVILQSPPRLGERISRILREECGAAETEQLARAEEAFFGASPVLKDEAGASRWTWDGELLERSFREAGFSAALSLLDQREERLLSPRDTALWFDPGRSAWGAFVAEALGEEEFLRLRRLLEERIKQGPVEWRWKSLLLRGVKT